MGQFTMADGEPFIDHYSNLQVNPNCDAKALEAAYRHLAKKYHPDHPETADVAKFNEVVRSYAALRNPVQRAEYDLMYGDISGIQLGSNNVEYRDEKSPLSDAEVHEKVLSLLYARRRENARDAGVGHYAIQEMLNCSDQHLEFHLWYLRAKGFIEPTEEGTLAISIEGVDHVISVSRATVKEKLLIAKSRDSLDGAQS
jgi:curved DNA-binding protein